MLLYRLLLSCAALPILVPLLWQRLTGKADPKDMAERLGRGGAVTPGAVWLHAASVGELAAAKPLAQALQTAQPDLALLITCNTPTGRAQAQGWNLPNTTLRLAPLDFRWVLGPFLKAAKPRLLIVIENELWPNRLTLCPAPVALVSARMSGRAAQRWAKAPRLAAQLFRKVALAAPQDPASAQHLTGLGLPQDALAPCLDLKAAGVAAQPDAHLLAQVSAVFPRDQTLLAASTHTPEEAQVLDAFALIRETRPKARLILAPRHPDRGEEVAAAITARGLTLHRRNTDKIPTSETDVFLADTLGEMATWYAAAQATFVGGSWAPRGGHTPFEPAAQNSVLLHGPDTRNFAEIYRALAQAEAAQEVADPAALAQAFLALSQADCARLTTAAATVVAAQDSASALPGLARQLIDLMKERHLP